MEEKKPNIILKRERELRGWSQRTVAERVQTTEQVVCRWESGRHKPNRYFQTQLCQLFGKSAEELGFMDKVLRSYREEEKGTEPRVASRAPQGSKEYNPEPSSKGYTIYNSSNSLIGQTSSNTLLQTMIDRKFSKGITYDLLSSNMKTMNFRDEWQYIVNNLVSEAKTSLRAMVFDTELTRWWNTIAGQIYMKTNMELLRRGVPIRRIFILSSIDTRLRMNTLMNAYVHHKIGIDVKVCTVTGFQNSIPFKPDMFSVHDNLFVALYYFSFEKPITNLLLEDKYILQFKSFYDELF